MPFGVTKVIIYLLVVCKRFIVDVYSIGAVCSHARLPTPFPNISDIVAFMVVF